MSVGKKSVFYTDQPLVIYGASGMLGSELTFYAALNSFSRRFVLHGSDASRLQGLKDELEESGFDEIDVRITTSVDDALSEGGYVFFARSTRAKLQSRESMLLGNAPLAKELGEAINACTARVQRVVCVSNPSDLMGLLILVHSGLNPDQVMSLSALDTTRFRRSLSRKLGIPMDELGSALTLGSHDMKMAPMIGLARHNGRPISEMLNLDEQKDILNEVMYAGTTIYKHRGHTAYQSPAVLSLRMLMADDKTPFVLPTSRYHHSERYPYVFGALPTLIDDKGCRHVELRCHESDLVRLDAAFASIATMRDKLIDEKYLPPCDMWADKLQQKENLVFVED